MSILNSKVKNKIREINYFNLDITGWKEKALDRQKVSKGELLPRGGESGHPLLKNQQRI